MKRHNLNQPTLLSFSTPVDHIPPPDCFTFPYYYAPHPLASIAIDELQQYLVTQTEWTRDFKLEGNMFAVLVVRTESGELKFLASFRDRDDVDDSVPNVFVDSISASKQGQQSIDALELKKTAIRQSLNDLKNGTEFQHLKNRHKEAVQQSEQEIARFQRQVENNKAERKQQRSAAESTFSKNNDNDELNRIIKQLGIQSSNDKRSLKALKTRWTLELDEINNQVTVYQSQITTIEDKIAQLNQSLCDEHQKAYEFTNQRGETTSLLQLFEADKNGHRQNPISTGKDENLPKLLQTAFKQGLTPVALGEFWWGKSPYDQIRQHKNLYPVCQSKCFEILAFMLKGIEIDESPLEQTPSLNKALDIVYEDDVLVVVNKPSEFLSVSGKYISDSVLARLQSQYPNATGPLLVHRLDMSTSGLLVFTLTSETNKHVQKQFIERSVEKRYTALLEGVIEKTSGLINLPLAGDMQDRPRQMVCHKQGRNAETRFEILSVSDGRTKVHLYPKTGRTHQLRVHCAHQAGLNTPIVGDDLYGFKDSRLHLHAGYLKLSHPITGQELVFEAPAEF
ncbi:RluA family pseudouridine synthase [uncultured Vibrio sp.]|uniref:RluA family pseudouridine synthase n=1 Tax=uncultured Vibrio sp. TaxID=114054 RepID=UPI0025E27922|nr:RluA family pseudouridine synthase [uncultured Vibrio sp.]